MSRQNNSTKLDNAVKDLIQRFANLEEFPNNYTFEQVISAKYLGVVYNVNGEFYSIDGAGNYFKVKVNRPEIKEIGNFASLQDAISDAMADEELKYSECEIAGTVDEVMEELEQATNDEYFASPQSAAVKGG
ncbi:uncharacterized protein RJT20DRAFT_3614 [Scheffersomyces xylosifermentans]|uniref:uncharacterized protein n=1 Tax=Scheffersomyces xylosifermentans TaxID=1304137 RepID=UPI00315DFB4D